MSEKSVEAAAELSAKVRAGTAATRTRATPAGLGAATRPWPPPDGPTLPWRRIPADPSPPSPRPLPSLALPTRFGVPPASAL